MTGEVDIGGDITEFVRVDGDIGTSTTNATITCEGDIAEISAGGDVWADIEAYDGVTVGQDGLAAHLPRLDILAVGGDLHGTFTGPGIGALSVNGDLYADLTVGLIRHGFFGDDDWRIGGSFKDGSVIETHGKVVSVSQGTTWGLRGRVVFNNAFDSLNPGVWEQGALVRVKRLNTGAFIELTGNEYTNIPYTQIDPAQGFGGGAAGVASFDLHGEGCIPMDGAVVTLQSGVKLPSLSSSSGLRVVLIRHYGPATWDQQSAALPVTIERRRIGGTGSWDDITDAFVAVSGWANLRVDLAESSSPGCSGEVGFFKGFDYRIEPVRSGDEALRCLDVNSDPLVNDDETDGYIYTFSIPDPCPADLDGDGVVGSADLSILLGHWETTTSRSPCLTLADLDHDEWVGSDDLAILLGSWGACPGQQSMLGGGGEPYGDADFESVEDYIEWLDSLTPSELIEHLEAVVESLSH